MFTAITNTKPFLKVAFLGFPGSGKTYTATQLAAGLHKKIGSTKPVVLFDTEKAGKFLIPLFGSAGIKCESKESRSLKDLLDAMKYIRENQYSDILIIDSITHVYDSLIQSYMKKNNRIRMQLQDYPVVSAIWQEQFLTPMVNEPYHIVFCGRAGFDYEDEKDEQTGKRSSFKSGIKMRAERNTEFDADLTILMEQDRDLLADDKSVIHTATVIKDRSTLIHGKTFSFSPDQKQTETQKREKIWAMFAPVIERLVDAPNYAPIISGDDQQLVKTEEDNSEYRRQVKILCEEIEETLKSAFPGQTADEKKCKTDAVFDCFGTRSWIAVQGMELGLLQDGIKKLGEWIEAKKNPKPETATEAA